MEEDPNFSVADLDEAEAHFDRRDDMNGGAVNIIGKEPADDGITKSNCGENTFTCPKKNEEKQRHYTINQVQIPTNIQCETTTVFPDTPKNHNIAGIVENGEGSSTGKSSEPSNNSPNIDVKKENKHLSKVKSNLVKVGLQRTSSFIRPKNAPTIQQSLKYGITTVVWLCYHSFVLAMIPATFLMVTFGCLWFININDETVFVYYVFVTTPFFLVCTYLSISITTRYIFGTKKVARLLFIVTVPFCICHISCFTIRHSFGIWFLSYGDNLSLFMFCFLLMKGIEDKTQTTEDLNGRDKRYRTLASDGTPMAIFKGFLPYFIMYYLVTYYLLPYFMNADIETKILGRVVVLPFLFNMVTLYQNSLIIHNSKEYAKYRMVFGNVMNFISLAILRYMITDSSQISDTIIMALSSGFFEVILWISYVPRSIYSSKIIRKIKDSNILGCCTAPNKIQNLNSVLPSAQDAQNHQPRRKNHRQGNVAKLKKIGVLKRLETFVAELNNKDEITSFVLTHREVRSPYVLMCELQFIIFTPTILFLCNPIEEYVLFQPFNTVEQFLLSIVVQLPIELITQILSVSLENYLYGIEIPVSKSWKYNLKPRVLFQSALISLVIIFLSTNIFWMDPQDW